MSPRLVFHNVAQMLLCLREKRRKKNHYNKQVDILMLKIYVTPFLSSDYNIVLHGTSIVAKDDVPAQVFSVSIKVTDAIFEGLHENMFENIL